MLRSAQPSQFSTYPIQNIDIPGLAVLNSFDKYLALGTVEKLYIEPGNIFPMQCKVK